MPQAILPNNFLYEERKCPICRKMKIYAKIDTHKTCEDCRQYASAYKHSHRGIHFSKKELAEIEEEKRRRFKEDSVKFGTDNSSCLTWRKMYMSKQKNDWYYGHIDSCRSCGFWLAHNKGDSLNLNNTKENYDELRGYEESFKPQNEFPEDNVYSPMGVFPMTRVCSICGSTLTPKGNCPLCNPESQ